MLAKAGIQAKKMDPRFHGDDGVEQDSRDGVRNSRIKTVADYGVVAFRPLHRNDSLYSSVRCLV